MNLYGKLLKKFESLHALVLGDLMLDEYISGPASRISPEAPVIVIHHQKRDLKPGGAANVAQNMLALGAKVTLAGVVGDDSNGHALKKVLENHHLKNNCIIEDQTRVTTCKTRVLAGDGHQVLRIDQEDTHLLNENIQKQLLEKIVNHSNLFDIIVISDYNKGTITENLVCKIIDFASKESIPIATNPKPKSIHYYSNAAALLSLNRLEAIECLGDHQRLTLEESFEAARVLQQKHQVDCLLLTLGEEGMIVAIQDQSPYHISAPAVEVYDTAGAGDTVIATASLGYAAVGAQKSVFELAARVSSCVVRHLGVATPTAKDLEKISNYPAGN